MAAQLQAQIRTRTSIERIDTDARSIYIDGQPLRYHALVLALGADARRPALEGDGVDAIITVNDLEDYRRLRQQISADSRIAILGGGLIGCEFANDLRHAGHEVWVVDRATWPLSRLLPSEAGEEMANALASIGVRLELGNAPVAVNRAGQGYTLQLADGLVLEADYVFESPLASPTRVIWRGQRVFGLPAVLSLTLICERAPITFTPWVIARKFMTWCCPM